MSREGAAAAQIVTNCELNSRNESPHSSGGFLYMVLPAYPIDHDGARGLLMKTPGGAEFAPVFCSQAFANRLRQLAVCKS